jgi:hypothetical protein
MALIADDEPILTAPPPAATNARFTKAVMVINLPLVDATGKHVRDIDAELAYDNPTLTDQQRTQFMNVVKFVARKNGVIA